MLGDGAPSASSGAAGRPGSGESLCRVGSERTIDEQGFRNDSLVATMNKPLWIVTARRELLVSSANAQFPYCRCDDYLASSSPYSLSLVDSTAVPGSLLSVDFQLGTVAPPAKPSSCFTQLSKSLEKLELKTSRWRSHRSRKMAEDRETACTAHCMPSLPTLPHSTHMHPRGPFLLSVQASPASAKCASTSTGHSARPAQQQCHPTTWTLQPSRSPSRPWA